MRPINSFNIKKIRLNSINLKDQRFRYTDPNYNRELIEESIKTSGILNPPLVQEDNSKFKIIAGFKRIELAKKLEYPEIDIILIQKNIDNAELMRVSLMENQSQRDLNLLEKVKAVICLENLGVSENQIVDEFMPMMGLNPSIHLKNELLFIDELPEHIKSFILQKNLPWRRIQHLEQMGQGELEHLTRLMQKLNLSATVFEEISKNLLEIARRDGHLINQVAKEIGVDRILMDSDDPEGNKLGAIRNLIKEQRFPVQSRINKEIEAKASKLNQLNSINVKWDKNLEESGLIFSIDIKSHKELEELKNIIKEEAMYNGLKEIWELIEKYEL